MSGNQGIIGGAQPTSPASQGQPSGYERSEGWARRAGRRKGMAEQGEGRRRERSQTAPPASTHPTAAPGPQPGANKARHGAIRTRQRGSVSPRLRNSTPGQGARATNRPGRAHAEHHAPERTTTQGTTPPRQTPMTDNEQAAVNKPRSLHSATAAVQMDVCAPGSKPSPCRLQHSCRPDGPVCARQ